MLAAAAGHHEVTWPGPWLPSAISIPPHPVGHALGHGRLESGAQVGYVLLAEEELGPAPVPRRS